MKKKVIDRFLLPHFHCSWVQLKCVMVKADEKYKLDTCKLAPLIRTAGGSRLQARSLSLASSPFPWDESVLSTAIKTRLFAVFC